MMKLKENTPLNYKKIVAISSTLSALLLTACGNGNAGEDSNNTGSQESESGDTLIVSIDGERYEEFVNEIKDEFEEEHNVTVEINNTSMVDQLESLSLDGPAGLGTDVMMAAYDRAGNLGQQGHLMELDLADDGRYDELSMSMGQVEDSYYVAPFVVETVVMYYNLDYFDELPETFEDLEELSTDPRFDYAGEEGTNIAFLANWTDFNQAYGLLAGYGAYVFGDNGRNPEDIGINSEGVAEGVDYITHWYQNIWPQGMQDTSSSGDFKNQSFMNGDTAANIAGTWMVGDFEDNVENLGITSIPSLPNGEEYQPFAGGKGWVASNYSEEPELSQQWIEYVTNSENSQLFFDITSEIPVNIETRENIVADEDNVMAIAVYDQFDNAVPMPIIPEMAEVWTGAQNMLFDAVSGSKTSEEALSDTEQTIRTNIEELYN